MVVFAVSCRQSKFDSPGADVIEVVGISDGDTLTVVHRNDNRQEKIRLASIDAPELSQPFGDDSKKSLSEQVFRKTVTIKTITKDQYGRTIAEVFADGNNVNIEQLRRGFAWYYLKHKRQLSAEDQSKFSEAETSARNNHIGLWQMNNPIAPWDYRARFRNR